MHARQRQENRLLIWYQHPGQILRASSAIVAADVAGHLCAFRALLRFAFRSIRQASPHQKQSAFDRR